MKFLRVSISAVVIVASLLGTISLTAIPARAQTLDDCQAYASAGDWSAAAEACGRVIQAILRERQAESGSYCDNDCDHTLAEAPDQLDIAQMSLAYSRATENEALADLHLGHALMAQYWMQQAVVTSSSLMQYQGGSTLLARMAAAARALHTRQVAEEASIDRRVGPVARTRRAKPLARPQPARPTCPPVLPMVATQAQPIYPDDARALGLGEVQVAVKVHLKSDGSVGGAKISESSGNESLDKAAMQAALQSTYIPAKKNCKPAPADADFRVTFDPNG